MRFKHTHPERIAAIETLAELAGDEVAALVLHHLELSRHVGVQLMEREVTHLAPGSAIAMTSLTRAATAAGDVILAVLL